MQPIYSQAHLYTLYNFRSLKLNGAHYVYWSAKGSVSHICMSAFCSTWNAITYEWEGLQWKSHLSRRKTPQRMVGFTPVLDSIKSHLDLRTYRSINKSLGSGLPMNQDSVCKWKWAHINFFQDFPPLSSALVWLQCPACLPAIHHADKLCLQCCEGKGKQKQIADRKKKIDSPPP